MAFKLTVDGEEMDAAISAYTFVLYEQEFDGADMIQDLLGKVKANEDESGVVLDFTNANWTALTKSIWACLKTADDSIPGFRTWSAKAGCLNLFTANRIVTNELFEQFFQSSPNQD